MKNIKKENDLNLKDIKQFLEFILEKKDRIYQNMITDVDYHWSLDYLNELEEKLQSMYIKLILKQDKYQPWRKK